MKHIVDKIKTSEKSEVFKIRHIFIEEVSNKYMDYKCLRGL